MADKVKSQAGQDELSGQTQSTPSISPNTLLPFTHQHSVPTHSARTTPASGRAGQWAQGTQERSPLTFIVLSSSSLISRSSGSINFRRIGVCPGCNCPLCSCLKHILGCHHDIELACRKCAIDISNRSSWNCLSGFPSFTLGILPPLTSGL